MPLMECGEGGYKWGESGKCFTGNNAKEKALAVGRAIKANDNACFIGDRSPLKASLNKDTGFLTASVDLARTGIQTYFGYELGLTDRALDKINVFRSIFEVFSKKSIDSFINLVVTDDHPVDMVNTDNVKNLQVGMVSEVKRDSIKDTLSGIVTITDKDLIKKIKDGKQEVSVGYKYKLIPSEGTFGNIDYEFIQTDIEANHLAIVTAGRCGGKCKILDKKIKGEIVKVTINGIDFETEDSTLVQAIQKQQAMHDAEKEKMKKEIDETEEEKKKLEKEKEKAEAAKDAAEKLVLKDEQINKLVTDRAKLFSIAQNILGDEEMPKCEDCKPREIKAAVIDKVFDNMGDLSKKSDDYIDASFDIAVEQYKKNNTSVKNLKKDFKDKKTDDGVPTRESVRAKYMKDQLKLEGDV